MTQGIFGNLFRGSVVFSKCLGILIFVFISIGSLGVYFNFTDPAWDTIGVSPIELAETIHSFPTKHCPLEVRKICSTLSNGTLWFLGLD